MPRAITTPLITPLALLILMQAGIAQDTESPTYRDVTGETRRSAQALARLEKPGRVLFRDDFETPQWSSTWFEVQGRDDGRAQRVLDPKLAHRGKGFARLLAPDRDGKASGVGASGWLGSTGHDVVHFRRYVRFDENYDQGNLHHTGGGLAGVSGTGKWDGMGKAGVRPKGGDRFTCGLEPWRQWGRHPAPGVLLAYTYWVDMKPGRDGKWWGNMLWPARKDRQLIPRGRWVCLEQMIRVNGVGERDGELAVWIDGKLYLHLEGLRWRTSERVRLKRFSIGIYVHEARQDNEVRYDDVVISTGYIGPTRPR